MDKDEDDGSSDVSSCDDDDRDDDADVEPRKVSVLTTERFIVSWFFCRRSSRRLSATQVCCQAFPNWRFGRYSNDLNITVFTVISFSQSFFYYLCVSRLENIDGLHQDRSSSIILEENRPQSITKKRGAISV